MEGVPVRAAEGDTEEVGEREGLLAAEREAIPGGGDSVPTGEGVSVAEAVGVADCVVEGGPPPPPPPPPALGGGPGSANAGSSSSTRRIDSTAIAAAYKLFSGQVEECALAASGSGPADACPHAEQHAWQPAPPQAQ